MQSTAPVSKETINSVIKKYNTLNYYTDLSEQVRTLYPQESTIIFSKQEVHEKLNFHFLSNYDGEEFIKYKISSHYLSDRGVIGAFEIPISSSRIDFIAISDSITSYEIKSKLDSLTRLRSQISNYMKVFDFNYSLTDPKHHKSLLKILPISYGIIISIDGKFECVREASRHENIDTEFQLKILTLKERKVLFPLNHGIIENIENNFSKIEISTIFIQALRQRYSDKWTFLSKNRSNILPIDYPFFLKNSIDPKYIYRSE
jgi:hypothetical protein